MNRVAEVTNSAAEVRLPAAVGAEVVGDVRIDRIERMREVGSRRHVRGTERRHVPSEALARHGELAGKAIVEHMSEGRSVARIDRRSVRTRMENGKVGDEDRDTVR